MAKKPTDPKRSEITLKRTDITRELHHKTGLSISESSDLVEQIFGHVSRALIDGEDVKLAGFGTFKLRQKPERIARNPKTNEEVVIDPRRVVTFKPSNVMKERVNSALIKDKKIKKRNLAPKTKTITKTTTKTMSGRIKPGQTLEYKTTQWIALFQLLGLLTFDNDKINAKKLEAFTHACFELKIINDPKTPITKDSTKSWLKTNRKRLLAARQSKNHSRITKMLDQLSPASLKLDIICAMVKISIADGHYGKFEQDIIKKAILHWDIPVKSSHNIDYACSDMILKTLKSAQKQGSQVKE